MAAVLLSRYEAEQGKLPPCCMRCGAPSVVFKQRKFSWSPSWIWLGLLVMLLTRKRMRVLVPLCERHKNHWRVRSWFTLGGLVLLILLVVALAILDGQSVLDARMCVVGAGTMFVLGIIWFITVIILDATSIRPVEITSESITLAQVSKEFIEPLRVHRLAHPIVLPEVPRTSSSPVLGIVVVMCLVVLVCIVAITALGAKARQPLVEPVNHFRLDWPGPDWTLLAREKVQPICPLAAAGAKHVDGRLGMILVEPVEKEPRIAGREQAIRRQLIADAPLQNKQEVRCGAVDFLGHKAVRYQFTGDNQDKQRMRIEVTVFAYQDTLYQVWVAGSAATTAEDGASFLPFLNAFSLLPVDGAP